MNKEDWAKVEEALKVQYNFVELDCDGYKVRLTLEQSGQFKLSITVYVNGWFRGEWFSRDNQSEEARRFFPTKYINAYSAQEKKSWSKIFSKKELKARNIDLNARREYKGFTWTSFRSMKRHFIKHNKEIQLIEA